MVTYDGSGSSTLNCSGSGVIGQTASNYNFVANRVYFFFVTVYQTNNTPSCTSGQSLTTVTSAGNFHRKIHVFSYAPSANATQNITFNYGLSGAPKSGGWVMYYVDGAPYTNNGADAIVQAVVDSATGADPEINTMSTFLPAASVVAVIANDHNPFGGSIESGWTEDLDEGCLEGGGTESKGRYAMSRRNTTDNTPSATVTSSSWVGIAIEVRNRKKAVIIN